MVEFDCQIDSVESLQLAGKKFGYPLMIKSKRLAYDGRGNAVAHSKDELSSAVLGNHMKSYYYFPYMSISIVFSLLQCFYFFSSYNTISLYYDSLHDFLSVANNLHMFYTFTYSSALGGYDKGLYVEKWTPFVKVTHLTPQ